MIRRRKVKPDSEFLILGSMIMSKEVMASAYARYSTGELRTQHFTESYRIIFRWLIQYYAKHRKPPRRTIQEIFKTRSRRLSEEKKELVEEFLDNMAEDYAERESAEIDDSYIKQDTIPEFIREREIQYRLDKAQTEADGGNFEKAETTLKDFHPVSSVEEDETLGTMIPYTKEEVAKGDQKLLGNPVYRFPGDLNYMIGPLCSSWLVAITGVEKSGKSFNLQEIGYDAALYQRKKVLIINIELDKVTANNRLWRRISLTQNEQASTLLYPILDCKNNQDGTCRILKRLKNGKGLFRQKETVSWYRKKRWRICDRCRTGRQRKNANIHKRFVPALWYAQEEVEQITPIRIRKALREKRTNPLRNLRIRCFPRFSITFDEAYEYILRYIERFNWKPDIIIFDYLDILAPEHRETRIDIDQKWKKAAKLAGELDCLVITADQANKAARTAYKLDQMSTTESKTKDSHLDIRIAQNQMDVEKDLMVARWNVLFHRHAPFSLNREVFVTQRLATAEPILDQAMMFNKHTDYLVTNKKF